MAFPNAGTSTIHNRLRTGALASSTSGSGAIQTSDSESVMLCSASLASPKNIIVPSA